MQLTQTPAILGISFFSSFIHFTDTTNLDYRIKLQWHLWFIYPLIKNFKLREIKIISQDKKTATARS